MAADTTKKHFIRIRGANVNNLKKQLLFINEKQEAHNGSRYNEEALYQDQRCQC